jgi:ADP-heptose:LPS heptosyltransferase
VMADDQKFKTDCRLWLGDTPCPVQHMLRIPDCAGCKSYWPSAPGDESRRLSTTYDPTIVASAGTVCIVEAGGLGSILRTTAVSRAIRAVNPRARIVWVTHRRGTELLSLVPGVHAVDSEFDLPLDHVIDSADLVVNFDAGPLGRSVVTRARAVAGLRLNEHGRFEPAEHAHLLQRLQIDDQFRATLGTSMQSVLVRSLGLAPTSVGYDLALPAGLRLESRAELASRFGGRASTVVVLNLGSSRRGRLKRWQAERWAALSVHLVRHRSELGVLAVSGPEDRDAREAFIAALRSAPASLDLVERIAVSDGTAAIIGFLATLSAADLVVTADTFALHGALALGVPVVALIGPMPHKELELAQDDMVVGPTLSCAPCFYRCTQPLSGACMHAIDVEAVAGAVLRRLDLLEADRRGG